MLKLLNLYEQAMEKVEGFVNFSWGRTEDGKKVVVVCVKRKTFTFNPELKTKFDEDRYRECITLLEKELENA